MKGKKEFMPAFPVLVNLEELVPSTHLLRRLNDLLDFAFIGPMTDLLYCQTNGRPSIDPEVFFRMTLVSYLYGLPSDRVLCAELQFNLAYRWFCRFTLSDSIPDHSSMTRIRDRLGERIFNDIFNQILELCRAKKLLKNKGEVLFDSSHIQADACVDSIVKRTKETATGVNRRKGSKLKSETYRSTTDEDAAMSGKKGVPRGLYYKVHTAVDAESIIILEPHVTTASVHDGKALLPQIDSLKLNRNFEVESVVADRAYGFGENLQELKNRDIEAFVGTFHRDVAAKVENLNYEPVEDKLQCQGGHWLFGKKSEAEKNTTYYTFKEKPCKGCEHRESCPLIKNLRHEKYFRISSFHQVMSKAAALEKTDVFIKKLGQRMWKSEGLFAEAKENHCLRRARYRGRAKVQIQAYMIAIVQNLKRLLSQASRSPPTPILV